MLIGKMPHIREKVKNSTSAGFNAKLSLKENVEMNNFKRLCSFFVARI